MLRALWLGRLDEAAPVQVPHGLLELEAPAELEAAAAVGEAAEPEGGIAQVAEQVCMVATADREYCSCARRIMLFQWLVVLLPAMCNLRTEQLFLAPTTP